MLTIFAFSMLPLLMGVPLCEIDEWRVVYPKWKTGGQADLSLMQHVGFRIEPDGTQTPVEKQWAVMKLYKQKKDFDREINILTTVDHPNIIKPICYHDTPRYTCCFIVFPYYPRGCLHNVPEDLPQKKLVLLAAQIVSAVWYLHEQGYTHQDIKPGNILLDDKVNAILIDFGFTHRIGEEEKGIGTLISMAPEVLATKGKHNHLVTVAIDWWAVGVTLWMVNEWQKIPRSNLKDRCYQRTGPFEITHRPIDSNRSKITYNIRKPPAHFEKDLGYLLAKLLVVDPEKRHYYGTNRKIFHVSYFKDVIWEIPVKVFL